MSALFKQAGPIRMMSVVRRLALLLLLAMFATPSWAQLVPPKLYTTGPYGLNYTDGTYTYSETDLSIGPLTLERSYLGGPSVPGHAFGQNWTHNFDIYFFQSGAGASTRNVVVAGRSRFTFYVDPTVPQTNFTPEEDDAANRLIKNASGDYVFYDSEGNEYDFSHSIPAQGGGYAVMPAGSQRVTRITYANGRRQDFTYDASGNLKVVADSTGYALIFDYGSQGIVSSACGVNMATFTVGASPTCSSVALKTSYGYTPVGSLYVLASVIDVRGNVEQVQGGANVTCVTFPATSTCRVTNTYSPTGLTWQVKQQVTPTGATWQYAYGGTYNPRQIDDASVGAANNTFITDPANDSIVWSFDQSSPKGFRDQNDHATEYYFNGKSLINVTHPELNVDSFGYDVRNNITGQATGAKPGSGLSATVVTYHYPNTTSTTVPSCDPPANKVCNKPDYTLDALGNQTDYTYDTAHGGVLTKTSPAGASGVRPQTRYTYQQLSASYRNTSGATVAGPAMWVPASMSECRTLASCAGTADEIVTSYTYDAHLQIATETVKSGSGTPAATTTKTYDGSGNVATVDGPLTGTADTGRMVYNAKRQVAATMSPDPDGASALKVRAVRTTYDPSGQPTLVEEGTATDQSDAALAAMAVLRQTQTTYDAGERKTAEKTIAGGTTYTVTQFSYDGFDRLLCTAVRMNPTIFASLPSDACTLGTQGSYGPDRITKSVYDPAGQLLKVQRAFGTPLQIDDLTNSYTPNGKVATVADGKGDVTTYQYDGLDRLSKTIYPTPGNGTVPSTTDYEQLTYDAGSNITQRRQRDGGLINYSYDHLNRPTLINLPGTSGTTNPDVSYTYDLQGKVLSATDTAGGSVSYAYDALGRATGETEGSRTLGSQYDAAGRRTRLTWSDGFYVTYDYLVTGEMSAVHENGATSIATFAYDDLGQRIGLGRSNGAATGYGYDPLSRLTSLSQDLAGTTSDQSYTLTYSPADQIVTRASANDAYAFAGLANVSRSYAANALNQYSQVSSGTPVPLSYDGRGNLTASGSTTYVYDARNMLMSSSAGTSSFTYDPTSRMRTIGAEGVTLDYDGPDLVAEYSGTTLLRRYVHGPGTDDPLVWYEGSGTTDKRWLHADHQGSIVAVSNGTGAMLAINAYDEYGNPGTSNLGRFQYTGQTWIPGIGLYNYKARLYSPSLGRFMQTDPTGYEDGINWYAYVGNDPINKSDPSGSYRSGPPCPDCAPLDTRRSPHPTAAKVSQAMGVVGHVVEAGKAITEVAKSAGHAIPHTGGLAKAAGPAGAAITVGQHVAGAVSDVQNGASVGHATMHHASAAAATISGAAAGTRGGQVLGATLGLETGPGAAISSAIGGVLGGLIGEQIGSGELSSAAPMTQKQQDDFELSHPN